MHFPPSLQKLADIWPARKLLESRGLHTLSKDLRQLPTEIPPNAVHIEHVPVRGRVGLSLPLQLWVDADHAGAEPIFPVPSITLLGQSCMEEEHAEFKRRQEARLVE